MMNNDPINNALNYLQPHKRLSQRIAIAQLRGEPIAQLRGENLTANEQEIIRNFLIDENFLSREEADNFRFVATLAENEDLPIVIDLTNFTFNIFGVSNQVLAEFLTHFAELLTPSDNSPSNDDPIPDNVRQILAFIQSNSNESPWSLVPNVAFVVIPPPTLTWGELRNILASITTPLQDNGSLFNVLQPSKKLSQVIAHSWLPNGDGEAHDVFTEGNSDRVRDFLVQRGLLSRLDAQHANIIVDRSIRTTNPNSSVSVYIGTVAMERDENGEINIYTITIPYPERPTDLTDKNLQDWFDSPDGEAPYTPVDISIWIPLTC